MPFHQNVMSCSSFLTLFKREGLLLNSVCNRSLSNCQSVFVIFCRTNAICMRISSFLENLNTKHDESGLSHVIKDISARFLEFGSRVSQFCSRWIIVTHSIHFRQGATMHPKRHHRIHVCKTGKRTKERNMLLKLKNHCIPESVLPIKYFKRPKLV